MDWFYFPYKFKAEKSDFKDDTGLWIHLLRTQASDGTWTFQYFDYNNVTPNGHCPLSSPYATLRFGAGNALGTIQIQGHNLITMTEYLQILAGERYVPQSHRRSTFLTPSTKFQGLLYVADLLPQTGARISGPIVPQITGPTTCGV